MERGKETQDSWLPVRAVVTDCRSGLWNLLATPQKEAFYRADYTVSIAYEAAGKTYHGTYRTDSLQEVGTVPDILYDPDRPERNSA